MEHHKQGEDHSKRLQETHCGCYNASLTKFLAYLFNSLEQEIVSF